MPDHFAWPDAAAELALLRQSHDTLGRLLREALERMREVEALRADYPLVPKCLVLIQQAEQALFEAEELARPCS